MAPFLSNEQIEGLVEIQRDLQLPFRYEDCIDFVGQVNPNIELLANGSKGASP